jgi:hypothetical protein
MVAPIVTLDNVPLGFYARNAAIFQRAKGWYRG